MQTWVSGIEKNKQKNKSSACGANTYLQLFLENSKSKKGHNYVKKIWVTCLTGMCSPFDSKN